MFLSLAGLAIWLCHAFGWAFLGLLCGSFSLHARWSEGSRGVPLIAGVLADCAVLLLALIPMLLWRSASNGAVSGEWSLALKILWLISVFRSAPPWIDWLSTGMLALVLVIGTIERSVRIHGAMALAALLCLAAFIALPARVFGSYYADMRLVPYMLMVALLALDGRKIGQTARRVAWTGAILFLALRLSVTTADYADKDRLIRESLPAVEALPRGARVANFAIEPCGFTWRLNPLRHIGGFAIARRSAFTNDQWDVPGANALAVHYPAAEPFVRDPSQSVTAAQCPLSGLDSLPQALDRLPTGAFTHVWINGLDPATLRLPFAAREIWRGPNGVLFALRDTKKRRNYPLNEVRSAQN